MTCRAVGIWSDTGHDSCRLQQAHSVDMGINLDDMLPSCRLLTGCQGNSGLCNDNNNRCRLNPGLLIHVELDRRFARGQIAGMPSQ